MESIECKSCGCQMNHADVRQLALYYRQEHPSMVAVQYVCPRCGATEWQQYDPTEWADERSGTPDWTALVRDLGLRGEKAGEVQIAEATEQRPAYDPSQAITMDEYIDFGCRVAQLGAADLRMLSEASG
ncbi:MAG: hypothetical protein HUU35_16045 [Armatimonadetes bacterium]|nr:hypothetical protein [Armatimonadota bacterium]